MVTIGTITGAMDVAAASLQTQKRNKALAGAAFTDLGRRAAGMTKVGAFHVF